MLRETREVNKIVLKETNFPTIDFSRGTIEIEGSGKIYSEF